MTANQETEIALLKQGQIQVNNDIIEIKSDIKDIKTMISDSFVTQKDFSEYRISITQEMGAMRKSYTVRVIFSVVVTVIITSLVSFFFSQIIRLLSQGA